MARPVTRFFVAGMVVLAASSSSEARLRLAGPAGAAGAWATGATGATGAVDVSHVIHIMYVSCRRRNEYSTVSIDAYRSGYSLLGYACPTVLDSSIPWVQQMFGGFPLTTCQQQVDVTTKSHVLSHDIIPLHLNRQGEILFLKKVKRGVLRWLNFWPGLKSHLKELKKLRVFQRVDKLVSIIFI